MLSKEAMSECGVVYVLVDSAGITRYGISCKLLLPRCTPAAVGDTLLSTGKLAARAG